jgi:hypothetical protein
LYEAFYILFTEAPNISVELDIPGVNETGPTNAISLTDDVILPAAETQYEAAKDTLLSDAAKDMKFEVIDVQWSPASYQPASISSAAVDLFSSVLQPSTWTPVPAINTDTDQQTFGTPLVKGGVSGLKKEEKAQQQHLDESSNVDYADGQQIYDQVADLLLLDGVVKEDNKQALEDYYYEHDVEPGFWDEADFYNDLDDDDNRNMKNGELTGLSKAERAIEAETNREFSEEGEESSGHRIGRSVGDVHHDDNRSLS